MILRQYLHTDPVAAAYLFGCGGQSLGAVVDPLASHLDLYMREADRWQLPIKWVIDTHVHADHISGARKLAARTGAQLVLAATAPVRYPFQPLADGEELVMGNVTVRALHTPGHTPEHMSLLVTDRRRGPEPWAVLTGHTLMIGDTGRPDLVVADGAEALYDSLDKLLALPDYVEILPGAFSGST